MKNDNTHKKENLVKQLPIWWRSEITVLNDYPPKTTGQNWKKKTKKNPVRIHNISIIILLIILHANLFGKRDVSFWVHFIYFVIVTAGFVYLILWHFLLHFHDMVMKKYEPYGISFISVFTHFSYSISLLFIWMFWLRRKGA